MQTFKNRYIEALGKLFLFSAIFHIGMLTIISLKEGDSIYLNYFKILDVDRLYPDILLIPQTQLLSLFAAIAVYMMTFLWFTKKK